MLVFGTGETLGILGVPLWTCCEALRSSLQDALRGDSYVTGTVNFEKSAADFGQPLLGRRQVLVQAVFEDVADGGKVEVVSQPP